MLVGGISLLRGQTTCSDEIIIKYKVFLYPHNKDIHLHFLARFCDFGTLGLCLVWTFVQKADVWGKEEEKTEIHYSLNTR